MIGVFARQTQSSSCSPTDFCDFVRATLRAKASQSDVTSDLSIVHLRAREGKDISTLLQGEEQKSFVFMDCLGRNCTMVHNDQLFLKKQSMPTQVAVS